MGLVTEKFFEKHGGWDGKRHRIDTYASPNPMLDYAPDIEEHVPSAPDPVGRRKRTD